MLCSGGPAPSGVAGQAADQLFAGGLEGVPAHADSQEQAPEGVLRVVGFRAGRAGGLDRLGAGRKGHAELDVGEDLGGVQRGVEGAELDALPLEKAVQVEQAVAAGMVVLVCAV